MRVDISAFVLAILTLGLAPAFGQTSESKGGREKSDATIEERVKLLEQQADGLRQHLA